MRSGAGQVGAVVAVMSLLAGCANFEAASGFAKESAALAASARPEFEVLAGLCAEQAGVHRLLMLNRAGQQGDPLTVQGDCRGYQGASEALVVQSLDVLRCMPRPWRRWRTTIPPTSATTSPPSAASCPG